MKKHTYMLAALLIFLLVIVIIVLQRPGEQSRSIEDKELLLELDSTTIDKFEIKSQFGEITLAKEGIKWFVSKPIHYPADDRKIGHTVSQTLNMTIMNITSTNPEKQSLYQVDSSAIQVKIYQNGAEKAHLFIGKAGSSPLETFVRRADSEEVLLVRGALSYVYNAPLKDWRDKTIFSMPQDEIKNINFQYGDESFTLSLTDSLWTLDGKSIDQSLMDGMTKSLSRFRTDFFLDTIPEPEPEITAIITIGDKQLRFAKVENEKYYVKSAAAPQWFIVLKWKATQILKKKEDLFEEED